MLLVQDFLKTHTFKDLQDKHGVFVSFDKNGYKFSLNYDQLLSKDNDLLAQQCRGLILVKENTESLLSSTIKVNGRPNYDHICPGETSILAYPMNRFFNYGQEFCAQINWNDPNLKYLEKLDGTLIILYHNPFVDTWYVATRSVPEADIPLDGGVYTFRMLFEKALQSYNLTFDQLVSKLYRNVTYCFELTSPYNRIVCNYDKTELHLIAARDIDTLREIDINYLDIGIPCVRAYTFACLNDILTWVSEQNPLVHEGIIVLDSNFNRIKIKNASYVAFSRARDMLSSSERNCLHLILSGKDDDVINMLPKEIVDRVLLIKKQLLYTIKFYDHSYKVMKYAADSMNKGDRKTFALLVNGYKDLWSAPFFYMFDGKANDMKDFLVKNSKNGVWSDSFLDRILSIIKNY